MVAGLLERNPDEPEALGCPKGGNPGLGRNARRVFELRNGCTSPVHGVAPAVVGTDDLVALDPTEGERSAAVDAQVAERMRLARGVAPEDDPLAEQAYAYRLVAHVAREGHRVPARA